MTRFAHIIVLAAFLAVGIGAPVSFASEPAPTEQKDKKDTNSGKADDDSKKDEKRTRAESNRVSGSAAPAALPSSQLSPRSHPPTIPYPLLNILIGARTHCTLVPTGDAIFSGNGQQGQDPTPVDWRPLESRAFSRFRDFSITVY